MYRTARNAQLYQEDLIFSFSDLDLRPGDQISLPNVWFTLEGYGPVIAMARWGKGYLSPIFLITNFELPDEAIYWYKKRFQIDTFFSDEKCRGFYLNKSHLSDPQHVVILMIAACLAYLWIIYLGILAIRKDWIKVIHRSDRCE